MSPVLAIKVLVGLGMIIAAVALARDFLKNKESAVTVKQKAGFGIIGFIFNFLDALGIGCFAPMMASLRLTKLLPDKLLPGTLTVSCSFAVAVEALKFLTVIEVDSLTLVSMLVAAVLGAVIGVKVSAKLPEKTLQLTMASGLALACLIMLGGKLNILPVGGEAIGLSGGKLVIALVSNFMLGLLLPLGIGNYGPSMAILFLLGMHPVVSFPIMMGSAAFMLLTTGVTFTQTGNYHRMGAVIIAVCSVPGVFIAVYLVKSMPLDILQWLVIGVCTYTSVTLYRAALKKRVDVVASLPLNTT